MPVKKAKTKRPSKNQKTVLSDMDGQAIAGGSRRGEETMLVDIALSYTYRVKVRNSAEARALSADEVKKRGKLIKKTVGERVFIKGPYWFEIISNTIERRGPMESKDMDSSLLVYALNHWLGESKGVKKALGTSAIAAAKALRPGEQREVLMRDGESRMLFGRDPFS